MANFYCLYRLLPHDKKFELQLLLCNILYQTLHMKLLMHLLYARSATIGHEVRYAITLIKLTFLFTYQERAMYILISLHRQSIAYMRKQATTTDRPI